MGCLAWRPVARPESVAENAPTVRPVREWPLALAPAPLVNQEIAIGCGRRALQPFPRRLLG